MAGFDMDRRKFVTASVASTTVSSLGATASADDGSTTDETRDPLDVFPTLDKKAVSAFAYDIESDDVVAEHNPDVPLAPASNTKLLTTALAFDRLGGDYRFETAVGTPEPTSGETVEELAIVGRGSPDLGADDLDDLAAAVADAGVSTVSRRIVADDSYFDESVYGVAWTNADGRFSYGAKITSLAVSRNTVDVTVSRPTDECEFEVDITPDSDAVEIDLDVECSGSDSISVSNQEPWTPTINVTGRLSPGSDATGNAPVGEPVRHAASVFVNALDDHGVSVTPEAVSVTPTAVSATPEIEVVDEPVDLAETYGTVESDPLSEILTELNAWSNNFIAEMIARTVAHESTGASSWQTVIDEFFADLGHETAAIQGGSGLSRQTTVSSRAMAEAVEWGLSQEWGDDFLDTIPVAGEAGTVRNRLGDVDGEVRAKTGSLSGVDALTGTIGEPGKPQIVFSILLNGLTSDRARQSGSRIDDFVRSVADHR